MQLSDSLIDPRHQRSFVRTAESISPVLESGNGNVHWLEGFLGSTSPFGIAKASVEVLNTPSGLPVASAFEADQLQISPLLCTPRDGEKPVTSQLFADANPVMVNTPVAPPMG